MRRYLALLLLAACGEDTDATLAARRAALGLPDGPVAFADAMERIRQKGYEPLLARVRSKRLTRDEVLDAALDLESLLARAEVEARPPDPLDFAAKLADARARATALARAVAGGGDGVREAGDLLASCTDCHLTYRRPR